MVLLSSALGEHAYKITVFACAPKPVETIKWYANSREKEETRIEINVPYINSAKEEAVKTTRGMMAVKPFMTTSDLLPQSTEHSQKLTEMYDMIHDNPIDFAIEYPNTNIRGPPRLHVDCSTGGEDQETED